jgi:adenylate cyclase
LTLKIEHYQKCWVYVFRNQQCWFRSYAKIQPRTMASLLPGFENDIFVSYRQNDNKYDGWVTEFVANLNKELEATIKDKISTYFDENSWDGLLETHDVDKSLANKLKSLIFIPVLSQTYCDPKSYAWQHEFLPFNKMAQQDPFGRDILLRNGNVASRILPVKIHDLDPNDMRLLQDQLGGPLRAVDFFFKEPGVNRPLKPEDPEDKNLNKTKYRNQVNKIANSIKEILISIQNPGKPAAYSHGTYLPKASSSPKSIAVLPFVNMSNDPEQEYFSDGISEEIINTLVQIPGLQVPGRTSSFSFKNKNEDLRIIGEKLNVNTILEGSVRKSGNRIRVTAQLIEASSGYHLWSQKYDRELDDVFIIQDEIARSIVENLQITLSGKPAESRERLQTQNVEAYQLYLKGMSFFYKRGTHMFEGIKYFEEALKIDPDYALALAGMADSYTMLCLHSYMPPEIAWPKAAEAADRAILIGPGLAEGHSAKGTIAALFEHNWDKAKTEYLASLKINPRYLQARIWYAIFYLGMIHPVDEEVLKNVHLAIECDPLSAYAEAILALTTSFADRVDEGIAAGNRAVAFDPESFITWYYLGFANHCAGNYDIAIQAYKRAIDISGRHNWVLASLLALYLEPSEYQQIQKAEYIYRELLIKEKTGYVSPFILAATSAEIGKNEEATKYLKEAIDRHDPYLMHGNRPDNKALRAIPEYKKAMQEIGLS